MYNIPEDKIKVIYLGGDHVINQNNPKRFKNDSKPFILFVGSREKYKDFNSLDVSLGLIISISIVFYLQSIGLAWTWFILLSLI